MLYSGLMLTLWLASLVTFAHTFVIPTSLAVTAGGATATLTAAQTQALFGAAGLAGTGLFGTGVAGGLLAGSGRRRTYRRKYYRRRGRSVPEGKLKLPEIDVRETIMTLNDCGQQLVCQLQARRGEPEDKETGILRTENVYWEIEATENDIEPGSVATEGEESCRESYPRCPFTRGEDIVHLLKVAGIL